jgi:hypothetical protein
MQSASYWGGNVRLTITLEQAAWLLATGGETPSQDYVPDLVLRAAEWIMERVPRYNKGEWETIPFRSRGCWEQQDTVRVLHLLEALFREKPTFPGAPALLAAWEALPNEAKTAQIAQVWRAENSGDPGTRKQLHATLRSFSPLLPMLAQSTFEKHIADLPEFETKPGPKPARN